MYPISFDNPNKGQEKGRKHPSPVPESATPDAANRNVAADPPETASFEDGLPDAPAPNSLLVVECRRDDKWRVELCTDLSELDSALDMARALRKMPDVDEVCLTLEVSGENGRESRREVIRLVPEALENAQIPAFQAPIAAAMPRAEPENSLDPSVMEVLSDSLKAPDYTLDGLELEEVLTPPANDAIDDDEWPESTANLHFGDEEPIDIHSLAGDERHDRQSAQTLLASLYRDAPEAIEDENAIRVEIPNRQSSPTTSSATAGQDPYDWLDKTQGGHMAHRSGMSQRRRHHADSSHDDDNDNDVIRFDAPLFSQQNGIATKLLVFAGTLALLVLGGALAELLAVDLTTPANAGVGAFDTLNPLQGGSNR